MNSLFPEWTEGVQREKTRFIIGLRDDRKLIIPVNHFSATGRHQYEGNFYLEDATKLLKIGFTDLIEILSTHISSTLEADHRITQQFISRVQSSEQNIDRIFRARAEDLNRSAGSFIENEQMLFVGHTFHPTPKSRDEFTLEDFQTYSPEMEASFPLTWALVQEDLIFEKTSSTFKDRSWLRTIFENEGFHVEPGYLPYPLHPWQATLILELQDIRAYVESGKLKVLAPSDINWRPTSSLRTLYSETASYMLKFSMNVKLTNSIRHLLVHELDRGLQVDEVFAHVEGKKFSTSYPWFSVIHEPVYLGIKDRTGNPIKETLILGRHNPFRKNERAIVLATLTQDHYEFHGNILHKIILGYAHKEELGLKDASHSWFKKFLRVAIEPLIMAQANYGILLGSHQQNMIVLLDDRDRPLRSYFRDCNGTGYSKLGKTLFGEIELIEESNGNILDEEAASYLFGYYVMINSTFNLLASIAHSKWTTEEELLRDLRHFLDELRKSEPRDPSFLNYLLENEFLMHKGNFLCAFRSINENTEKDPLSIYSRIPNPLFTKGSFL